MKQLSLLNLVLTFCGLLIFWLFMSGYYDPFHIGLGVVCVLLVMYTNHSLNQHTFYQDETDVLYQLRYGYALYYGIWMAYQIVVSGFSVAIIILTKSLPICTYIVRFRVELPGAHARMILGNSITLTPGTLTIDIQGNEYTVYALTPEFISQVIDGTMPGKVARLFTKDKKLEVYDIRFYSESDPLL